MAAEGGESAGSVLSATMGPLRLSLGVLPSLSPCFWPLSASRAKRPMDLLIAGHSRVLANSFPGSSPYEGYNYGSFGMCPRQR